MWLRVTGPFAELELRVCMGARAGARVFDEDAALALLRPTFGPGPGHPRFRALLDAAGLRTEALDDDELLPRIARLIARGEIDVIVHPRIPIASESIERIEPRPQAASRPAPLEAADHWIELAVQTADGTALPGIRCEITLPWGTVVTLTTDRLGLIRLDGLPDAGDCEIRFIAVAEQDEEQQPVDKPEEWELVEAYVEHDVYQ